MGRVITRWLITAVAVAVAIWLIPGVEFWGSNTTLSLVAFAAVLALINAFIKPILQLISLPVSILTLGFFALVVNTGMLYLSANIGNALFDTKLYLNDFWSALLASIVISLVSAILGALTGVNDPPRNNRNPGSTG